MDFVTFEIAKKLKEKGFREECFAHYPICGEDYEEYNCIEDDRCGISLFDLCRCYNNEDSRLIDAPTISQVLKWLREKYSIHISTKPYSCEDGLLWPYEIRKFNKNIVFIMANKTGFTKEEQASLAGIEYVLDNLI